MLAARLVCKTNLTPVRFRFWSQKQTNASKEKNKLYIV